MITFDIRTYKTFYKTNYIAVLDHFIRYNSLTICEEEMKLFWEITEVLVILKKRRLSIRTDIYITF